MNVTQRAAQLIATAHDTVADCRTQPLTDAVLALDDGEARRLLQAVAMIAGTLAVALPDDTRHRLLGGYLNGDNA